MKRFPTLAGFVSAFLLSHLTSFCQTSEAFNSRPGVESSQVKHFLEQSCWQFYGFDMNSLEQLPPEGDGAIISAATASAGFYTPVLNIWGSFTIAFKYAFLNTSAATKSIGIYLTDGNNEIIQRIDSIDVTGGCPNNVYEYNNSLAAAYGSYKLYIRYEGGTASQLAIDELALSASLRYPDGCNIAPTAVDDVITGTDNRTASGYITTNDMDPNGESVSSYLINACPDGNVNLAMNGYFSFTPNPGFKGQQTSFTYQVCDYGQNQLCSDVATVTILFPAMSSLPLAITDIQALTKNQAIDVRWTISNEAGIRYFEVQRSTDGVKFEKAGTVMPGQGHQKQYLLSDRLNEKIMTKNDLYYRLKQVNADGEINYSKTIIVRVFKTRTLQSVTVAPNPAVNDIRVNFQLRENAFIVMKLTASDGHEVYRKSVKALNGTNGFTLEGTGKIRPGMYVLEVIVNSNERMVIKVIKN